MRVLLTGGTGFVGLALADALGRAGARVTALSAAPPPDWAPPADWRAGDVRDREALAALLRDTRADILIHAAAMTPDAAQERAGDAATVVAVNVGGTANAVEAAAAAGVRRVMALSSVAVYGRDRAECPTLDESTERRPATLYAVTKDAAERLALRLGALHGVRVIAPRLGPLWGPWERRTGERGTPSPPFQMLDALRRGAAPAVAPGAAAPLVYVADAVDALLRLLEAPGAEGPVNVGARATTDLAAMAAALARRRPPAAATAPGEPIVAADRPPMRLDRLEALIGSAAETPLEAALDAWLAWLDALPDPDAPFAAP